MFNSKCYLFKNNKYSDRKVSHRYMHNCSLPPPFYLCLRHDFSSHTQILKQMLNTGRDLRMWVKGKNHLISYHLVLHFTNRWALAWEHAPGCYLNEDAGPLQSKEWPSRLHILPSAVSMTTKSHAHYRPLLLNIWLTDVQMSTPPSQVNSPGVLHFHFYPSLAHCMQLGRVTGHAHFYLYFLPECLYVLLLLFELTPALTASLLLYLASVFLYVIRISRDRSAIQSWAIFYCKSTVLIHLLGLKEALYLKYHSLFHIRASTWRFNHSNGQRLTAHLHRSRGQCIGCFSEKEIECYFLVVIIYLSFRIETCRSMVWIMHVKAGRISLCVYLRIFGAVIYECVCIYFKQPRVHIFVLLEKENSMHDIQYNILWYYMLSSFIDMLTL